MSATLSLTDCLISIQMHQSQNSSNKHVRKCHGEDNAGTQMATTTGAICLLTAYIP